MHHQIDEKEEEWKGEGGEERASFEIYIKTYWIVVTRF
jgi:hypothetical protein